MLEVSKPRPKPKLCQVCGRVNPGERHSCLSCRANLDNPIIEVDLKGEE